MDFDATLLYPSAMWDEKSKNPKTETGYAFTTDMNDKIVENVNTQKLSQSSAISINIVLQPSRFDNSKSTSQRES